MSSNINPLLNELVTFIQHQIPGLEDGEYLLTVSQRVNDSSGNPISDDSLSNAYVFAVLGDRFGLSNPGQSLSSVFPPLNATGEFTTVLPHVVLNSPTFPYERFPTTAPSFSPPPPGADTDADVPTWLTVLLLDEDDVAAYPDLSLTAANVTTGDLFPPSVNPSSSLGSNYSYFYNATDTSDLEPDESLTDNIQVLDVPLQLFWAIAPTVADLQLTAHVRQVSLVNKPTGQGPDPEVPVGTFSIVFGTRLPQTQKKAHAYLVSLEELQPFLPTDEQGGPPTGNNFDAGSFLRLSVLTSWTFFSTGETATFVNDLLALNRRDPNTDTDAVITNLLLPYYGTNPVVQGALEMGYVPLNETLRIAGRTVSWYRGPCVPYQVAGESINVPIASPDQAAIFDPTTGMFDVSYAAAWTLGRMLALQDTAFSTALYNWKKGLTQAAVNAIEDSILQQTFSAVLSTGPELAALKSGARPSIARALLKKTVQAVKPRE